MARVKEYLGQLTIASGTTTSGKLSAITGLTSGMRKVVMHSVIDLIIYSPATLPETVNPKVSRNDSDTVFNTVTVNGSAVALSAGAATVVPAGGMEDLQVVSTTNVAADRTFDVVAQLDI